MWLTIYIHVTSSINGPTTWKQSGIDIKYQVIYIQYMYSITQERQYWLHVT